MSPDGRSLYLASDRRFADNLSQAACSTREHDAGLDGPGTGRGDTGRAPTSAVREAIGRTPR